VNENIAAMVLKTLLSQPDPKHYSSTNLASITLA